MNTTDEQFAMVSEVVEFERRSESYCWVNLISEIADMVFSVADLLPMNATLIISKIFRNM